MSIARVDSIFFRRETPTVSVVIVNFNGKDYLNDCLTSVEKQHYDQDKIEIIIIDNASTDGSVEYLRENFPRVRVIVNSDNVGFAPAVNQGAQIANGDVLALLNNDATADPNWIPSAVSYLQTHEEVGVVASAILHKDGTTIDYAGGELSFYGHGFAAKNSKDITELPHVAERTLFASGGAMFTKTKLFLDAGGFDPDYFAFFEDVDFGWRLWNFGIETHLVPSSFVYHEHHGTIKRFGYARERYMLERNALATVYKNYGDENANKAFSAALMLTLGRGLSDLENTDMPDMRISSGAENVDGQTFALPALSVAHISALRDFIGDFDLWSKKRDWVQANRTKEDKEILPMFKKFLRANASGRQYTKVFERTLDFYGIEKMGHEKVRVLILTNDSLGIKMAGPAIRCWEMAKVLTDSGCKVTLASDSYADIKSPIFDVTTVEDAGGIDNLLQSADVIVVQGFVLHHYPAIGNSGIPLVCDMYDPFHVEAITQRKHENAWQRIETARLDRDIVEEQMVKGDFFLCSSEKQRDFWLGHLAMASRINPYTFDQDESLRPLIDVAPFGMSSHFPEKSGGNVLRGVVDGIDEDDFLLVWGGGIYNWFDPLTLIRAVGKAAEKHPKIKLWFMGKGHPNPNIPKMFMASNAYNLAEELGLLNKHVFFNEGWVDYSTRADYLLEANVGVSTHYEHLETRYSYRTRVLDYIWCTLPIISTGGDTLSDVALQRGLGLVVPPEDEEALTEAICKMYEDKELYDECVENLKEVREEMTWEKCLQPLVDFCANPIKAADLRHNHYDYVTGRSEAPDVKDRVSLLAKRTAEVFAEEGPRSVVLKGVAKIRRKFSKE